MNSIMFIYLLSIAFGLDTESCKTIECSSVSSYCMYITTDIISVDPCTSSQNCPGLENILSTSSAYKDIKCTASSATEVTCGNNWDSGNNPAGWTCCSDNDCISRTCFNSTCTGKSLGELCETSEECETNTYCNGKCAELLADGDHCNLDNECPAGSGCNTNICTKLFSLALGETVSNKKFCQSNFMYTGKCNSLEIRKNKTTEGVISPPYECTIGTICYYYLIYNNVLYSQSSCFCSGVPGTSGYCLMIDGVSGADLTSRISYNSSSCSGFLAHTTDPDYLYACGSISQFDQLFYTDVSNQRKFWPLFQSGVLLACAESLELFNPLDYGISASLDLMMSTLIFLI